MGAELEGSGSHPALTLRELSCIGHPRKEGLLPTSLDLERPGNTSQRTPWGRWAEGLEISKC